MTHPLLQRTGDFGIAKLGHVARANIVRFTHRTPSVAWTPVTVHLLSVLKAGRAPHPLRVQASRTLDSDVLLAVPRALGSAPSAQASKKEDERRKAVQRRLLDVLAEQVKLANTPESGSASTSMEIKRMGLETLHEILQSAGHTLLLGWETIFDMIGSVCEPSPLYLTSQAQPHDASQKPVSSRSKPPPLGYEPTPSTPTTSTHERGAAVLVRIAFQSLTLVCDSLSSLSPAHLQLCIRTLGQFGRQHDTNIALTAASSLLWGVSDALQAKRRAAEVEEGENKGEDGEYGALWMLLLREVQSLCTDPRPEVRVGAVHTLFRSLQLYGGTLSLAMWEECLWHVTFPLLDSISSIILSLPAEARAAAAHAAPSGATGRAPSTAQAWDESKALALTSIGALFADFLPRKLMRLSSFERAWDAFVVHVHQSFTRDAAATCAAALRSLERALKAVCEKGLDDETLHTQSRTVWTRAWQACDEMGVTVLRRPLDVSAMEGNIPRYDQESLLAYVDVIRATRGLSKALEKTEWPVERLQRLLLILKGQLRNRPDVTFSDSAQEL